MKHPKIFIIAYICLVGLPLLALVGVLDVGRKLIAPPSVDGPWMVEADFRSLAPSPCAGVFGTLRQPLLLISQSGTHFDFALNSATRLGGEGALQGSQLTGSGDISNCAAPPTFVMTAAVSGQASNRTLDGRFSIPSCVNCTPVSFHAIRPMAPRVARTR